MEKELQFIKGTLIEDLEPVDQENIYYVIQQSAKISILIEMIRNRHSRDHRFSVDLRTSYLDLDRPVPVRLTQSQVNLTALIARRYEAGYYLYPNINLMMKVPDTIKEQFGHLTGDVEV